MQVSLSSLNPHRTVNRDYKFKGLSRCKTDKTKGAGVGIVSTLVRTHNFFINSPFFLISFSDLDGASQFMQLAKWFNYHCLPIFLIFRGQVITLTYGQSHYGLRRGVLTMYCPCFGFPACALAKRKLTNGFEFFIYNKCTIFEKREILNIINSMTFFSLTF